MAESGGPTPCQFCGRPLSQPEGRGRKRRYCDATCRSAARRRRAAAAPLPASVNDGLTTSPRQAIVDNVPGQPSALAAVGQAQARARSAEEELAVSVAQARQSGHTWAEIGQVLGTSRQAAFQRFGRPADPRTGQPMPPVVPGARELAAQLFGDLAAGRWAAVCAQFGPAVAARLDPSGLAAAWAQVIGMAGEFERRGAPMAYRAGDYTVVDVPLFFEAGERTGRVSYDQAARVTGLFFLPTERTQRDD
jgi:hypothetical protein